MNHFRLLLPLLFFPVATCFAQGWLKTAGSPNYQEVLKLVWLDTDSTFIAMGDSATDLIIRKRFDFNGQFISDTIINSVNYDPGVYALYKRDFGVLHVSRYVYSTSWDTYNSFNYIQLINNEGATFGLNLRTGINSNDYYQNDGWLLPDSSMLVVGQHTNPDENKLYIAQYDKQNILEWEKEIHDSTKNILGLRIFPSPDGNFLILATRQGNINSTHISQIGFLKINTVGDLLETNWIPQSGYTEYIHSDRDFNVCHDAAGISYVSRANVFYHFDLDGHLLWQKKLQFSSAYNIRSVKSMNDGFILAGDRDLQSTPDAFCAKIDPQGNKIWEHNYNFQDSQSFYDVVVLPSGGFVLAGKIANPQHTSTDYLIVKLNADGTFFNNVVEGCVFADMNGDCIQNQGEQGIEGVNAGFSNGFFQFQAVTAGDGGHFQFPSDTGDYTLKVSAPPGAYWSACTDSISGSFATPNVIDTICFGFQPKALCPELHVYFEAGRIRPCFESATWVRWENIGTAIAENAYFDLSLPDLLNITTAQMPYTDLGNHQFRFQIGTVPPFNGGQTIINIAGSCDLQIGDTACLSVKIFPDTICAGAGPFDPAQFQFVQNSCSPVRNSFDPNDKTATPIGYGTPHYVPDSIALTYLIRFQNTGNDTAFQIVVRDTLPPQLDPFTVAPEFASHPYRMEFQEDGSLKFIFDHILLVDSFTNEPASHGFIRFRVAMRPALAPETQIKNRAGIYFDFNPPVMTNTEIRTTEPLPVVSWVSDLPASRRILIYPDPADAFIRFKMPVSPNTNYHIYNTLGMMLRHGALKNEETEHLVSTGDLPEGVYFLFVTQPHEQPQGNLFIVKR